MSAEPGFDPERRREVASDAAGALAGTSDSCNVGGTSSLRRFSDDSTEYDESSEHYRHLSGDSEDLEHLGWIDPRILECEDTGSGSSPNVHGSYTSLGSQQFSPSTTQASAATAEVALISEALPRLAHAAAGVDVEAQPHTTPVAGQGSAPAIDNNTSGGETPEAHTDDAMTIAHEGLAATNDPGTAADAGLSSNRDINSWPFHPLLIRLLRGRPEDMEGLRNARTQRLIGKIRRQLLASVVCFGLNGAILVMLLVNSLITMSAARGAQCDSAIRSWLFIYFGLQLSGPLSIPVAAFAHYCMSMRVLARVVLQFTWPFTVTILVFWCLGPMLYIRVPGDCAALHRIGFQALLLQISSLFLLFMSSLYLMSARPLVKRLNAIVLRNSFSVEIDALTIPEVPTADMPMSEDCVICLGCIEDGENGQTVGGEPLVKDRPPWRRLQCGHRFHEECLFTWLRKVKRCPVCRSQVSKGPLRRRSEQTAPLAVGVEGPRLDAAPQAAALVVESAEHMVPTHEAVAASGSDTATQSTPLLLAATEHTVLTVEASNE